MNPAAYIIPLVAGLLVLWVWKGGAWIRRRRRREALSRDFPDEWVRILRRNLPVYDKLESSHRKRLHAYIQEFIADKTFEEAGGLKITDEIRVTIAAQACMLIMSRETECYPRLRSIVVYPHTYVAGGRGIFGGQFETASARLGESWGAGTVVLSWNSAKQGSVNFRDGHNTVMHEFAHQLDQEDGAADGIPILERRSAYSAWAQVLTKGYKQFVRKRNRRRRRKDVLNDYAATNPAEFFAVATETFFEKPRALQKYHPELFRQLAAYYRVDPAKWQVKPGS